MSSNLNNNKPGPSQTLKELERRGRMYASYGYDIEKERQAIIEAAQPVGGRLLEAGTGKGHFALSLARLGYRLVSFDLSAEQLQIARENLESQGLAHLVELKQEDGEKLSFPDNSFEVIFSVNLVHHLKNPWAVLSELIRVLSPEGKLVISDFSPEGLAMMEEIHRKEGGQHEVAPTSLDQVEEFLRSQGFAVKRTSTRFQITLIARRI